MCKLGGRDHNATSYSTETHLLEVQNSERKSAEIITLRAIALKLAGAAALGSSIVAEIITLRAIALKHIRASFNNSPSELQRS